MTALALPGYSELRELGSGAFGRVVVARHDATGQLLAAKLLSPQLLADAAFRRRFQREAEIMAEVRHPNVVAVYAYIDGDEQAVILMELIEGVALENVVDRGPMGPEAALAVLSGALLGLEAAHRVGIIHRDVKPANILVDGRGGSHLADFGISARSGQVGVAAGTPAFMAPEQWSGLPATPQTDVYAATGVYYQCVMGRAPFPGTTVEQLRDLHLWASPDLTTWPEPLCRLILRGMAKDPAARPATAGAFHDELERAATAVYGPDWRRRGLLALGGAAGALAAMFPLTLLGGNAVASVSGATTVGTGSGVPGVAGGASATGAGGGTIGTPVLLVTGGAALAITAAVIGALTLTHSGPSSTAAATPTATITSAGFSGTWLGTYTCSQGVTGLRLTVSNAAGNALQATFEFHAVPSNPHVPTGSFSMTGHTSGNTANLVHDRWITQAPGYVMVDLVGTLRGGGALDGSVSSAGCGSFSLTRQGG